MPSAKFTLKVLPLLKAKCFGCHGDDPEDIQGAFDVRDRDSLLRGGESEEASIVPGDPDASPLFRAVKWEGLEMPPKENDRLSEAEIELVRRWIVAGAPWPDEAAQERASQPGVGHRVDRRGSDREDQRRLVGRVDLSPLPARRCVGFSAAAESGSARWIPPDRLS